ncbi:MAG: hypothetical protein ABR530_11120, partial [Pyrinomonadaceae bacterium]
MNKIRNRFLLSVVTASMMLGFVGSADAQRRNERDVRDAVRSLNSRLDDFEYNLRDQMRSISAPDGQIAAATDDIRNLRDSVQRFEENLDRRRENRDDVNNIVAAARQVDSFLQANPQNRRVQDDWTGVRRQIERLGANYGVIPNWNMAGQAPQRVNDYPPNPPTNAVSVGLSGTYQLDMARSENVDDIISDTRLVSEQREDLKDKLVAPEQIAIHVRGNQITLATTNAAPVTFIADGRDKTERTAAGKTLRLRATMNGQVLTVSSLGGDTDYTITFTFVVPNGVILTTLLENEINTKVSQNNDRFRLLVQSPAEFRGAIIEGYISGVGRSGKVTGRSNVTLNFERITLRNRQSYDFAEYLQ